MHPRGSRPLNRGSGPSKIIGPGYSHSRFGSNNLLQRPTVRNRPYTVPTVEHLSTLSVSQQDDIARCGTDARRNALQGLSASDRNVIESLASNHDNTPPPTYYDAPIIYPTDPVSDDDWTDTDDEGTDNDRLKRRTELYSDIVDNVYGPSYVTTGPNWSQRRILNTERAERRRLAWATQITTLTTELLQWRRSGPLSDPPAGSDTSNVEYFTVDMWSTPQRDQNFPIPLSADIVYPNQALVRHGLLSNSPLKPTIAFTIHVLELYRCLRNRKPSYSVQAFVRALCDLHFNRFQPLFARQFSEAYDIYLELLRNIDARTAVALNRASPDWRLRHACPACHYKLEGEEGLTYEFLLSIDGGNSLKRFASPTPNTAPPFPTDYFVSRADVDLLANEVVHRTTRPRTRQPPPNDDDVDVEMELNQSDGATAAEGTTETANEEWIVKAGQIDAASTGVDYMESICTERWKANAPDHKKGMFSCFDKSGIFIAICRHGIIYVVCDMVMSGELAKYPLALLKKIAEVFPGSKLVAYDIGCSFKKTAANSSIGPFLNAVFLVPALHAYAHNRACQLTHHPIYFDKAGTEDYEGSERSFSLSNECARLTRHATCFHRHQAIDAHYRQTDFDRYAALGTFLLNNYRQALTIISEVSSALERVRAEKRSAVTGEEFERWIKEEKEYLDGLTREPEEVTLSVGYAETLDELWKLTNVESVEVEYLRRSDPTQRQVRPSLAAVRMKIDKYMERVVEFEDLLHVGSRWTPTSEEYLTAKKYLVERKYHLALDHLERLVIQRLFELQKTHLSSTGYKLRTLIAKHLKTRSNTIKTAIRKYNAAAKELPIPRPPLTSNDVLSHDFLAQFDLLRDSRSQIQMRPWAEPAARILMDQYFKMKRAQEEIQRLNIEIRRVRTWIRDDEAVRRKTIDTLKASDPNIAAELLCRLRITTSTNIHILKQLDIAELLAGFTGTPGCGLGEFSALAVQVPEVSPTPMMIGAEGGGAGSRVSRPFPGIDSEDCADGDDADMDDAARVLLDDVDQLEDVIPQLVA